MYVKDSWKHHASLLCSARALIVHVYEETLLPFDSYVVDEEQSEVVGAGSENREGAADQAMPTGDLDASYSWTT